MIHQVATALDNKTGLQFGFCQTCSWTNKQTVRSQITQAQADADSHAQSTRTADNLRRLFGTREALPMGAFVANNGYTSGNVAVTSFQITVPTGTTSTSTLYILACTAATGGTVHSATGMAAESIAGTALGTSGRATLLSGKGFTGGQTFFVTTNASGLTGGLIVSYDGTTTKDLGGAATATNTGQNTVAASPGNTSEANELVISFAVFLDNAVNSINSVSAGTIRANVTAGGNTRFMALAVSDRIVAASGVSIGTVTWTANAGAQLGSTTQQISHKAVVGGGGGGTSAKVQVAGAPVSATPKVMVGGVVTTATPKVLSGGSPV